MSRMDTKGLMALVAEAYAPKEGDAMIPRFATQFGFCDRGILIRIPIYEYPQMPPELLNLICRVVFETNPDMKRRPQDIRDVLRLAAGGGSTRTERLSVSAITETTSTDSKGAAASAVVACVFSIELQGTRSSN